ncbi:HYC_CC_PP family protein [Salinimicrobium soli]|uniref:HYC_CC_PP family protein n=1 Tax=Salinimicrobium soli TaxID=1254399 RepID=UPI003AAA29DF
MKKLIQKTGSLLMALLVLFSTMSFTVDKHFCGSILVDQAVFSKAESCGMEHAGDMTGENGCKDQKVSVEGQKDLKISFNDLDLHQQVFLASFTYTFVELFEEVPQQAIPFSDYSPPLLVYDIHLLDETFLI